VPSQKASRAVLLARACSVAEGDVLVNVVADGLDAAAAEQRLSEPRPGGLGEPVALAISATREQYQGLFDRTG
jgi:hypothetical protein